MIIIVNQIPVTKLDPTCQLTIQSCTEEFLKRTNEGVRFLITGPVVFESDMSKKFNNSVCGELLDGILTDSDTIIVAVKSGNGYTFNQLVLNK